MSDLNTMMREHARAGLQAQLDNAVTSGDQEAARKIAGQLAQLEVSAAPKAPPYGDVEIRAQLDKQPWFGTDPKKSAKAVEFGKTMDPKKFATAEAFAKAIVDAVDAEFKPATPDPKDDKGDDDADDKGDDDADDKGDDDADAEEKPPKKPRRSDGPGEGDAGSVRTPRRTGPWLKLGDAPREIQAEIKRSAAKFVPATATKEQRAVYEKRALESHYATHVRTKGKK